jgi:hypothetical protein
VVSTRLVWQARAKRELLFEKQEVGQYFEQRIMLEYQRGLKIPVGGWLALSDPFTADPRLFKRTAYKRSSDRVLLIIQVIAAIALEIAFTDNLSKQQDCAEEISEDLAKAGLRAPGGRKNQFTPAAVKKWRQHCKSGSHKLAGLYSAGLEIFRDKNTPWRDILGLAVVEVRLRKALHDLHCDDPAGIDTRAFFEEFFQKLRQEHEQIQREYFARHRERSL